MKFLIVIALVTHGCFADPTIYNVGIGIADITGPAAEINTVCFPSIFLCPIVIKFHLRHEKENTFE